MLRHLPYDLDAWLPSPAVTVRHRRHAAVDPATLWAAAAALPVDETGALGRLVRWRIPGLAPDVTFARLFEEKPFTILDAGQTWSISGLVGRIWTIRRDYPSLDDAAAFARWSHPGTVRVLFAHHASPVGDGRSALVSEARIAPVDRRAAIRLRALWAVMAPWEHLIGREALARVVRRAEAGPA